MSLLTLIIVVVAAGFCLWLIDRPWFPMSAESKTFLRILVLVVIAIWLLKSVGVFDALAKVHI